MFRQRRSILIALVMLMLRSAGVGFPPSLLDTIQQR